MKSVIVKVFLFTAFLASWKPADAVQSQLAQLPVDTVHIPTDLEDCLAQVDRLLPDSVKSAIAAKTEEEFTLEMHMNFGMWMRNNWKLWGGSPLSEYFNAKGIYHPDDMTGIILNSYYRRSKGSEIKLEEQINYYQSYWKVVQEPSKGSFPRDAKKFEFTSGMYYTTKTSGAGLIHVAKSAKSSDIWLYDYYRGWQKVSKADLERLRENPDTREFILDEIYKHRRQ